MITEKGSIWDWHSEKRHIVITTNIGWKKMVQIRWVLVSPKLRQLIIQTYQSGMAINVKDMVKILLWHIMKTVGCFCFQLNHWISNARGCHGNQTLLLNLLLNRLDSWLR